MNSPLMLSARDKDLLGAVSHADAMGVLAVWTARGRDLVPHLTEQTSEIRGFQILVEALRLWEQYEREHPEHAGRTGDFFLLVEQAFARAVGARDKKWPLPGARRVRARANEKSYISIANPDWHLLDSQTANGIWGLYRGAGVRAGLLRDPPSLSDRTHERVAQSATISPGSVRQLWRVVSRAMEGGKEPLPTQGSLQTELCRVFDTVPLKDHLNEVLIESHALNSALAKRLIRTRHLEHRTFFEAASRDLSEHHKVICQVIRCENLLAVMESIFFLLCASANKGKTLRTAADSLQRHVDLDALERARMDFGRSGAYSGRTAAGRQARFYRQLKTSNHLELATSVLSIHSKVSKERGRAAWVWTEGDKLFSDMEVRPPSASEFQVEVAWRNDYYLLPLRSIALQLDKVRP